MESLCIAGGNIKTVWKAVSCATIFIWITLFNTQNLMRLVQLLLETIWSIDAKWSSHLTKFIQSSKVRIYTQAARLLLLFLHSSMVRPMRRGGEDTTIVIQTVQRETSKQRSSGCSEQARYLQPGRPEALIVNLLLSNFVAFAISFLWP